MFEKRMQSELQMGLIQVSNEKEAEEGYYSFSVHRKGWVIQSCLVPYTFTLILDGSSEKAQFTYAPLTTRWHICTPYNL